MSGRALERAEGLGKKEKKEKNFMDTDNSVTITRVGGGGGHGGDKRGWTETRLGVVKAPCIVRVMCRRIVHLKPVWFC